MTEPLRLFLPGAFAGLREALTEGFARAAPETTLAFHAFVPSGVLARVIVAGEPADVFVSANPAFMDDVRRAGLVSESYLLAGNRLCIIAHPERATGVAAVDDLLRVQLVVPQPETDPCGRYVMEMFDRAGLTDAIRDRLADGAAMHSRGSGDLPGFIDDGRADAGVFYASEAQTLGDAVRRVDLPPHLDLHDRIAFVIGVVRREEPVHPAAEAFVAWLLGPDGQRLLEQAGFVPRDAVPIGALT